MNKIHLKYIYIILLIIVKYNNIYSLNNNLLLINEIFNSSNKDSICMMKKINKLDSINSKTKQFIYDLYKCINKRKYDKIKYINNFPDSYNDISFIYNYIELNNKTPIFLYSFDILGNYAIDGYDCAIDKVYKVYIHSDGIISESMIDYIKKSFLIHTKKSVLILDKYKNENINKILYFIDDLNKEEIMILKNKIKNINLYNNRIFIIVKNKINNK